MASIVFTRMFTARTSEFRCARLFTRTVALAVTLAWATTNIACALGHRLGEEGQQAQASLSNSCDDHHLGEQTSHDYGRKTDCCSSLTSLPFSYLTRTTPKPLVWLVPAAWMSTTGSEGLAPPVDFPCDYGPQEAVPPLVLLSCSLPSRAPPFPA